MIIMYYHVITDIIIIYNTNIWKWEDVSVALSITQKRLTRFQLNFVLKWTISYLGAT